ncbi:5-oxopent-3-ene-1,2,5-tricarboxylate decarboxylase/2-hydroxyhepta-2,4-diene-1,7-dioate isomerase [Geomicrobium halophilum]|uniref:5-oxopent-3-ene-1,2,5-tricarboxylate decarboxylase/2-hydroxyhepta-2,4-diene-1,7-dioate isomerase n=1 Tax=Geomicrobium halophilum TaxID=549000 RepID=A0A841PVQ8_9BACL|nr:fumarylacetoacetate hydrolase family protein [Geomicrobium halophilum]MBB6451296.1 5-oxopent-3-ene-1,2,5-tricarboxylate decarboxylase/2-hydroxyhepta-2,4-diene-1,7-dioate isomerase [Geomicrobium halophilum]
MNAKALIQGSSLTKNLDVQFTKNWDICDENGRVRDTEMNWEVPVTGTIYGVALNYRETLQAYESAFQEKPYNKPPEAPVLYIKPKNTWTPHQAPVYVPEDVSELQTGPALGVVLKQTATQVSPEDALDFVAGYTVVNDVHIPHESLHRPAIKEQARDRFCPIGPWVLNTSEISDPDHLQIKTYVNDQLVHEANTSSLVRSVRHLISDVTAFMSLGKGDVLMVGVPHGTPRVKSSDTVKVEIEKVGILENTIQPE